MSLVYIAKYKRWGHQGIHLGGVAKHAFYLQMAIPELQLIEWYDFPDWGKYELKTPDWRKAQLLNEWLLREEVIGKDTTVICDGFWGGGLQGSVKRLISVCHGSFVGQIAAHAVNPWPAGLELGEAARMQEAFWKESGCEIVAVSKQAANELRWLSGIDVTSIIRNGIPTGIFRPRGNKVPGLIVEASNNLVPKGADIVNALREQNYEIEPFGVMSGILEDEAKRWDEASVLLFPSRYEGNSYTVLEAMACGCIPVAYWTGLVPNIGSVWGEFTDDFHEAAFRRGLDIALDRTDYPKFPEAFTLDMFGNDWKELLERE